jgi:hypothetical protein
VLSSVGLLHFGIGTDVDLASLVVEVGAVGHQAEILEGKFSMTPSLEVVLQAQLFNQDSGLYV